MKSRIGFVSNSSSSSFVSVGSGERKPVNFSPFLEDGVLTVKGAMGETEFGWGPDNVTGAWSMFNFAYLQTMHDKSGEWLKMLEKALATQCEFTEIVWDIEGYIDHQSSACEGENTYIFDSQDELEDFLFCLGSEVVVDNDNHF